jgi:hypothetical protein
MILWRMKLHLYGNASVEVDISEILSEFGANI